MSVEDLAATPLGLPELPADRVAHSRFQVTVEGAEPGDLTVAHLMLYVEKIWIRDNGIHKWSLTLDRYNEGLGAWTSI